MYGSPLVVEMTTYNETLLGIAERCGQPEPFKTLVVMSNHTLALMVTGLSGSGKSIGLFGLLVPDGALLRIIKVSSSPTVATMPYMPTEFDLQVRMKA